MICGGVATLAACVVLWVALAPQVPAAANQSASQPERGYEAGGAQCKARDLLAITDPVARQAKRNECANQRENHRQEQSDLVQQTRAANAAEIVAALTEDQTRIALVSAILSVLTAGLLVWTLWETRSANRTELRAYVIPEFSIAHRSHLKPRERRKAAYDLAVTAHSKNSGQTPATDFVTAISVDILPSGSEAQIVAPKAKTLLRKSVSVISAQAVINTTRSYGNLTPEQVAGLTDGTLSLFCWGVVSYRDVFKRQRASYFKVRYAGQWPPPYGSAMTFCDEGNSHT